MLTPLLIALGIFFAGFALSWLALRINRDVGLYFSLLNGLFGRLAALGFLIWISARLIERGGVWIAAGVGLGLISLVSPGIPAAATVRTLRQVLNEGWTED